VVGTVYELAWIPMRGIDLMISRNYACFSAYLTKLLLGHC
jgi:hypothetical protein